MSQYFFTIKCVNYVQVIRRCTQNKQTNKKKCIRIEWRQSSTQIVCKQNYLPLRMVNIYGRTFVQSGRHVNFNKTKLSVPYIIVILLVQVARLKHGPSTHTRHLEPASEKKKRAKTLAVVFPHVDSAVDVVVSNDTI